MPTIDNLNIQLQADAVKASDAITRFSNKIGTLASSLMQIEKINVSGVSTGINRLATAMQNMNNISTANLNTVASSLSHLTRSFNQLGSVTGNVAQISTLAQSLSRLGGANVQRAVTTIPQLEIALNNLLTTLSRANVNANVIALMNSISNLGNRSTAASTQINTLNRTMNNLNATTQRTSRNTFSLASAFGYLYASFFWVRRIIGGLNGSIESTADYLESFNYYTVALKKIAQEWDEDWDSYGDEHAQAYSNKFITTLNDSLSKMSGIQINVETGILESTGIKNLGLNINEITQASAQLASVTNSIGQTGEVSLATSSAFTKLSSDMSSLYNMDYSAVMTNLQSGLIGQSRALYKYGIDITNASLQTLAYELGVEKSVSEMNQMEKQQLRIIQILRGSKVAWGDQSNTINSLANQMRLLENNGKEISIVFGQLFTPIMENLLPIVNGMAGAVKNLMTNIAVLLGITRDVSTAGQGQASEIEQEMLDAEDGTDKANEALKEYKNQMMGFDEAQKLNDTEANATLNTNLGDTIDLEEEILKATSEYEKFWEDAYNAMEDKAGQWTKFFEKFTKPLEDIFSNVKLGFDMDFKKLGTDIMGLTTKLNDWITTAISKMRWGDIGWKFGQFITGSAVESFKLLGNSGTTLSELIIGINEFISRSTEGIEWDTLVLEFANGITNFFSNLQIGEILDTFADTVIAVNDAIIKIIDVILDNPEPFADAFVTFYSKLIELGIAFIGSNTKIIANLLANITLTTFENSLDITARLIQGVISSSLDKMFTSGVESWQNGTFGEWLANAFSTLVNDAFNTASNHLEGRVTILIEPLVNEAVRIFDNFSEIGTKIENAVNDAQTRFQEEWGNLVSWFENSAIPGWWETVRQNFTMERWRDTIGSITEAFTRRWNGMRRWFSTTVTNWWTEIENTFSAENWERHLTGIEEGFETAFNNAVTSMRAIWNNFATWINNALTFDFEGFNRSFEVFGTTYEIGIPSFTVDLGKLPMYKAGGFPEDGLFFANHDELIGEFPNGKTAVANSYQIQEGIEEASYRGMARALTQYQGNGGNVTVVLQGDADGLFKVVQNKANNYAIQTGQSPFLI